ncbi:MAG: peptide ABC transporter substrate-binding protein [Patescibacteria group bacterium]|nr:peptide ABC transporter substrate-binding protein [Patescibacteria group bacterium]MDE2116521.1 peptide ABC transporter substrate-binding protein [Patescibacteria group bacterium]
MEPKPSLWSALFKERKAKGISKLDALVKSFSITEKVLFVVCAVIFAAGALSLLGKVSDAFSVDVPARGGSLVEGIVGTPRFVNPLLAVSDADRDLTELVYSGLLKDMPDGSVAPDLAESYNVSQNGLDYSVTIRSDARFSDGEPVTADDVLYTIQEAQDPTLKSPRFVNWQGVTVEKTGTNSVVFHLKQPYAPFIENLTMGIMPAHIWKTVTVDQIPFSTRNADPIGSGPYEIASVIRSSDGIPTEFILKANPSYALGAPYIPTLYIKPFNDEQGMLAALENGTIESASNLSPESAKALASNQGVDILSAPLTRIFGVFFNQNQNEILAHAEVRKALDMAIDKQAIVRDVLDGYGTAIDGPLPPTVAEKLSAESAANDATASSSALEASSSLAEAEAMLAKAGWKKDPVTGTYELVSGRGKNAATTTLSISLATADVPELVLAAKEIESDWTALGVQVDVKVFEPSDLNQSVIRPRKYDALLFGLVTGKSADLYPFWDSSQRNDPGLNIAMYTNSKADALLEAMRAATSSDIIASDYGKLQAIVAADEPAIFLWSPDFLYAVPKDLHGVELGEITTTSDRFLNVKDWYISTDRVWNIFVKN